MLAHVKRGLAVLAHADTAGANSFHFSGVVGGRVLHSGRYVLSALPETITSGSAQTTDFTIIG
jgi:hypothetical protein